MLSLRKLFQATGWGEKGLGGRCISVSESAASFLFRYLHLIGSMEDQNKGSETFPSGIRSHIFTHFIPLHTYPHTLYTSPCLLLDGYACYSSIWLALSLFSR